MTKIQIARKILKLERNNKMKPSSRYAYVLADGNYKSTLEAQLKELEININNK